MHTELSKHLNKDFSYKEKLAIGRMTCLERVEAAFINFPDNQLYYEGILTYVHRLEPDIIFNFIYKTYDYAFEITIKGLCTFRKHLLMDAITGEKSYRFSFKTGNSLDEHSGDFSKEDANTFCKRALPFMVSYGRDRSTIPLLVNDFLEFSRFALGYTP